MHIIDSVNRRCGITRYFILHGLYFRPMPRAQVCSLDGDAATGTKGREMFKVCIYYEDMFIWSRLLTL